MTTPNECPLDYLPDFALTDMHPGEAEPTPRKKLFRAVGEVLDTIKPTNWLIKGYLERDSLVSLYAPPATAKTFLAVAMSACVATGKDWYGHPVKQGAVIYIAGEGQNGIAKRLQAWSIKNSTDLSGAPLAISTTAIQLDDPATAQHVAGEIQTVADAMGHQPALIVVDTLARNFGGDENSTPDMNAFIRALDNLRHESKATVLVVHHTGKDTTRGARGSSVLRAAVDAEYSVSMDELRIVMLQAHKMKEAELPPAIFFKLEGVPLPFTDEDGEQVWSCAAVTVDSDYKPPEKGSAGRGKRQTQALAALVALYAEHGQRLQDAGRDPEEANVTVEDWRDRCNADGIPRNRFNEVKRSLQEQDRIHFIGPYVHPSK